MALFKIINGLVNCHSQCHACGEMATLYIRFATSNQLTMISLSCRRTTLAHIYSRRASRFTLFFTLRDIEQKNPLSYFNNILIPRSLLQKSSRTADNDNAWSSDGRDRSHQQRAAIHLIMPHYSAGKQQRKHEEAVWQGKMSLCRRHSHHEFHNFTAQIFT